MNNNPLVSVCIPAYNHDKYIADCVKSVLAQTISDFEIVITDDMSSDQTVAIIETFSDERIRLFRAMTNQGPSATANNNIRQARGQYICFLASDDRFQPEKLERQLAFLQNNPDVGIVFSYMRYVDEGGAPIDGHPAYRYTDVENRSREEWLRKFFFEGNYLSAPTAMIRREVFDRIGLLDIRLLQTQDFDFWIRACLHYEIHVLPERLIDYRIRASQQNTSAPTPEKQAQTYWELSKVLRHFCQIEDEKLLNKVFPELESLKGDLRSTQAKIALLAVHAASQPVRVFGIDALYNALVDDEVTQAAEENGYDLPTFYKLAGDIDALGVKQGVRVRELEELFREADKISQQRLDSLKAEYDWAADQARRWETAAVNATRQAEQSNKDRKEAVRASQEWKQKYEQAFAQSQVWQKKYEKSALPFLIRRIFSALQRH
ncbi:glycosyltransferase [Microvirga sp. BSC39]|uniref:glycosyltransferase family 2 protein n=1 Tax=Microvirga sp. BSC39 TaxID=1549810 RepID=UPI00068E8BC5|nr:glycosyltransferase [Microvirga sp. BSC39]